MPNHKRIQLLPLTLCLLALMQTSATKCLAASEDISDSTILINARNGTSLLDKLMANVNSLGTYKYEGSQEAQNGNKLLKASGTFFFKPTDSMRVEVAQFGSKTGSVLVKNASGRIKAKGGPQMFGIKMSLSPDSRLLQMPNGLSAFDCDLSSLFNRLKKEAASGGKILVAEQPMQIENLPKPAIVIESQMVGEAGTKVIERVFLDPASKVPMQWDLFDNGKFQSRSKFENYQTNLVLDDSQFTM